MSDLTWFNGAKALGIALPLFVAWWLKKSGYWYKPKAERTVTPGIKALFRRYTGPYQNSGAAYQQAFDVLKSSDESGSYTQSFAIYLDDPDCAPAEKLRYSVGVVANDLDKKTIELFKSKGYEMVDFPGGVPCVATKFPCFLAGGFNILNIIFAVSRCYKVIYDEVPKSRVAAFELCDMKYTNYYLPIPENKEQEEIFSLGYELTKEEMEKSEDKKCK